MMNKTPWKIISYLLHPLFMPTLGVCFIMSMDRGYLFTPNSLYALLLIPWSVFGCTALLPLFSALNGQRRGKISSLVNPTDHDRFLLIIFSEIGFLLTLLALHFIPGVGRSLYLFIIGINIAGLITAGLSSISRTSLHTTGAGGLAGMVIGMEYYTRLNLNIWIGISLGITLIAGYARYRLKAHQPQEIYVGYLVGILSVSLAFIIGSLAG